MIIDTHAHIGRMINFNMKEEQVLRSMEKYGVDFSLVSNIEASEFDHRGRKIPFFIQKSQKKVLKRTLDFARENPDKIGALLWLKIAGEISVNELEKTIAENRELIFGFKFHPFHSKVAPDDKKLEPVYALAKKYGLPVVSHTGGNEFARSIHLYNAAKTHPEIDFVMVHMDLGTDNSEALALLGKLPNLYGDTTWVPIETTLEAIRRYGSSKMLFGTDNPIDGEDTLLHNGFGERSLYQKYFREIKEMLSKEEYEDLMWRNAKRVFKLNIG